MKTATIYPSVRMDRFINSGIIEMPHEFLDRMFPVEDEATPVKQKKKPAKFTMFLPKFDEKKATKNALIFKDHIESKILKQATKKKYAWSERQYQTAKYEFMVACGEKYQLNDFVRPLSEKRPYVRKSVMDIPLTEEQVNKLPMKSRIIWECIRQGYMYKDIIEEYGYGGSLMSKAKKDILRVSKS